MGRLCKKETVPKAVSFSGVYYQMPGQIDQAKEKWAKTSNLAVKRVSGRQKG
jgi:hypothetical protein